MLTKSFARPLLVPLFALCLLLVPALAAADQTVAAGEAHSCAIKADGTLGCWGDNAKGQSNVPADLGKVVAVAVGNEYSCAIRWVDQRLRCWGSGGNGLATEVDQPQNQGQFIRIAAGLTHVCALKVSRTVICAGSFQRGETLVPDGLVDVMHLTSGQNFTCAADASDPAEITCWGSPPTLPRPVVTGSWSGITSFSTSFAHLCAVDMSKMTCFGLDDDGQTTFPGGMPSVIDLIAGRRHTCGRTYLGQWAYCWGSNSDGQTTVPGDLGSVVEIAAGSKHNCARRTDGTLRCWGSSDDGRLGGDPSFTSTAPSEVDSTSWQHQFTAASPSGLPVEFTVTSGALPPGLSLSPSGLLSGSPSELGSWQFTVTADDGVFRPASQNVTLAVTNITPDPGPQPGPGPTPQPAPSTLTAKLVKPKLKSRVKKGRVNVTGTIRLQRKGLTKAQCRGKVKLVGSAKVGKTSRRVVSKTFAVKFVKQQCRANVKFKLNKRWRGKRVKFTTTLTGNKLLKVKTVKSTKKM